MYFPDPSRVQGPGQRCAQATPHFERAKQVRSRNKALHVAALPAHRWVQRLLSWHPIGSLRVSRPRHTWESKLHAYCRYANLGSWRKVVLQLLSRFLFFNFSRVLSARSHGAQPGELAEPMGKNGRNKETEDPIPARAGLPFHAASAQTWRQQGWLYTFAG